MVSIHRESTKTDCLWPAPYNEDTPEAAWAFVQKCKTWDESGGSVKNIPDHPYLKKLTYKWWQTTKEGKPLHIKKSRRLVVSWLLCALDVWDGGRRRCNIVQGGIDYDKASDFVYRCWFIYSELIKDGWKIPKPYTWGNVLSQRLDKLAFPNNTVIEPLNSDGESFRGSGYTRVKLEELSAYRYIAKVLSQASAVTQGPPGEIGGHIVTVSNQVISQVFEELTDPAQEIEMEPYQEYLSKDGKDIVRIHYTADPSKDERWKEEERARSSWTEDEWALEMEMLTNAAMGALWTKEDFERPGFRLPQALVKIDGKITLNLPKGITRIAIGVDPNVSDPEKRKNPNKSPDACGIVAVAQDRLNQGYVLCDLTAVLKPSDWGKAVFNLYALMLTSGLPVVVVGEANQGGDMVRETIQAYGPCVYQEVHATQSKRARAEPVSVLYKHWRVFHCGTMNSLESRMRTWDPENPSQKSPNEIDALAWAFHGLGLCAKGEMKVTSIFTRNQDYDDED